MYGCAARPRRACGRKNGSRRQARALDRAHEGRAEHQVAHSTASGQRFHGHPATRSTLIRPPPSEGLRGAFSLWGFPPLVNGAVVSVGCPRGDPRAAPSASHSAGAAARAGGICGQAARGREPDRLLMPCSSSASAVMVGASGGVSLCKEGPSGALRCATPRKTGCRLTPVEGLAQKHFRNFRFPRGRFTIGNGNSETSSRIV